MICYGSDNGHLVDAKVILSDFRYGFQVGYHYDRWSDLTYVCNESDIDGLENLLSYFNQSDTDQLIDYVRMKKMVEKALKNSKQIDDYSNCLVMDKEYETYFK